MLRLLPAAGALVPVIRPPGTCDMPTWCVCYGPASSKANPNNVKSDRAVQPSPVSAACWQRRSCGSQARTSWTTRRRRRRPRARSRATASRTSRPPPSWAGLGAAWLPGRFQVPGQRAGRREHESARGCNALCFALPTGHKACVSTECVPSYARSGLPFACTAGTGCLCTHAAYGP